LGSPKGNSFGARPVGYRADLLRHAQDRAAAARVGGDFGIRGKDRLAHQSDDRLWQVDSTHRHALGRLRRMGRIAQKAFHDAIFQ
jgi:hypothetical protein